MNQTKHCLDRYAERILGYTDMLAARNYTNSNAEKVAEDINKLIEFSTLIWTGQLAGDKSTKNYRMNGQTILVTDTANSTLITLYKVEFGLERT